MSIVSLINEHCAIMNVTSPSNDNYYYTLSVSTNSSTTNANSTTTSATTADSDFSSTNDDDATNIATTTSGEKELPSLSVQMPTSPSNALNIVSLPDDENTQIFIGQCTSTSTSDRLVRSLIETYPQEYINMLRRELMIHDMKCFELHSDLFKKNFIQRLSLKHLMLHMPKAGGTTICKRARRKKLCSSNCYIKNLFCPFWCCCPLRKKVTCETLQKDATGLEFIMNESRHSKDIFCDGFMYSALLREPVARSLSHIRHLGTMLGSKSFKFALGRQNYQTWALSGGELRLNLELNQTHVLDVAKSQLARMDLIIDLGYQDVDCVRTINMLLQIGDATNGDLGRRENVGKGLQQSGGSSENNLNTTEFVLLNQLDIELYNYAKPLMEADCKFVKSLRNL